MKYFAIWPYKMGSKSATALSRALQTPQIRHTGSKFKGANYKTVINWGASEVSKEARKCRVLNPPELVSQAGNKLAFFRFIANKDPSVRLVPWTADKTVAYKWLTQKLTVVCRQSLTGHSGRGIIIVEPGPGAVELASASLYTQYVPKESEWRIHVMNGKTIFRQRKIKDPDVAEPKTWKVRSHDNGFIYQHLDLTVPKDVEEQALKVMRASGLFFGAVDVIYHGKSQKAYVLEVNNAPGLEGATVEAYANAFRQSAT